MSEPQDAIAAKTELTFTRYCFCRGPACADCRSWLVHSNVPFHVSGPLLPTIADTVGVDGIRLMNMKYSLIVIVAPSFDDDVVKRSIRDNVEALGAINHFTGMPGSEDRAPSAPVTQAAPPQQAPARGLPPELVVALARTLEEASSTLRECHPFEPCEGVLIIHGKRFAQVYPRPPGMSRFKAWLVRWLVR